MSQLSIEPQITKLLAKAIAAGNLNDIPRYVAAGGDVNGRGDTGAPPFLHQALMDRNYPLADLLLSLGADSGAHGNDGGWSAAHFVSCHGDEEGVRLLEKYGCDLDIADQEGNTPLHIAALWGLKRMAAALAEAGADPTRKNNHGQSPAQLAVASARAQLGISDYELYRHMATYLMDREKEWAAMHHSGEAETETKITPRRLQKPFCPDRKKWSL